MTASDDAAQGSPQGHLQAALWYANLVLRVLPLHDLTAGKCSCGRDSCSGPGKHPRIDDWTAAASTDAVQVSAWWRKWPEANIGIATGQASGAIVLDVDPRHGGDESLRKLEAEHGALPRTWTVKTGGGGQHIYFRYPEEADVQSSAKRVGPGLDVRAEGGQVVAPPSQHVSGSAYEWLEGQRPGEVELASIPEWLLSLALKPSTRGKRNAASPVPGKVAEGSRNDILTSLAGTMRRRGMSEESIAAALVEENALKCDPPLDEDEVRRIAGSVAGYEPEDPVTPSITAEDITRATLTMKEVIEKTATDAGAPFEAEAVEALRILQQSSPAEFERSRAALRGLKVSLRRLEEELGKEDAVEGAPESSAEDDSQAALIVALASEAELFHQLDGDAFATLPVADHKETWPLRSRDLRRWLVRQYYESTKSPPKAQSVADAICLLEARAQFDGDEHQVHVRIAGHGEAIYIDSVNDDWTAIEVTTTGWKIIVDPPVRFRRARSMGKLPPPELGGSLEDLRPFVNIANEAMWRLLVVYLTCALRPSGPYPILALHGEQGSAKSTTARVLRALIDPNTSPLRADPRDARDLMIAATNGWVVCYDNLSNIPSWLSDALCRLATGGGFSTRALYTDNEETIFDAQRPAILTGIEELATRADLLERCLLVYLPSIPEERRRCERSFWSEFKKQHARILGALLELVSRAMHELPKVSLARLPRMADFATWGVAVEQAIGWNQGSFLAAYDENRWLANDLALEASSLGNVLVAYMKGLSRNEWTGTATDLLELLVKRVDDTTKRRDGWTKSAKALSNTLRRLVPNLRPLGVEVTFVKVHGRREIRLESTCKVAPPPSPAPPESQPEPAKDLGQDAAGVGAGAQEFPAPPCAPVAPPDKINEDNNLGNGGAGGAKDADSPGSSTTDYLRGIPESSRRQRWTV